MTSTASGCDRCDEPGGPVTFANQVRMPIKGRTPCIDWCIHPLVAALNAANITTVASCCGHEKMYGNIILEDGRTLIVRPTPESMEAWGEAVGANPCYRPESSGHTHQQSDRSASPSRLPERTS